jgi:miniconductance mechanosensitive channel
LVNLILLFFIAVILYKVLRVFGENIFTKIAQKSKTKFDDFLVENKFFLHLSNLLTINFISLLLPDIFGEFEELNTVASKIISTLTVVFIILLIKSILRTLKDYLKTIPAFKDKPVESYIQVFMIITWLFGFIFIFGIITDKSIGKLLTGLGALSAIILLIFKDTILGFVASIQVSVNDTVRLGDWITMEKYGADGDVFEINLASVKVRNFDNTITTIPTYYLISDSFKNWRGMSNSGGRRIKRAIYIKANSIKFLTEDEINNFKKIQLIQDYLVTRHDEIKKHNQEKKADKSVLINGRNLTNFGLFRIYIDHYLQQHPKVNTEMMTMSRQLQPTSEGIPLEIYAFSSDKVWVNYERIMADIFDHVLAAVPYFDLEVFEHPTTTDVRNLAYKKAP